MDSSFAMTAEGTNARSRGRKALATGMIVLMTGKAADPTRGSGKALCNKPRRRLARDSTGMGAARIRHLDRVVVACHGWRISLEPDSNRPGADPRLPS